MPAYVIAHVDVTDPQAYEGYRSQVMATVTAHGGRFLVRGGAVERVEGNMDWKRIVVLEFADKAAAWRWYNSPEYQRIAKIRQSASRGDVIVVEGAPPA